MRNVVQKMQNVNHDMMEIEEAVLFHALQDSEASVLDWATSAAKSE